MRLTKLVSALALAAAVALPTGAALADSTQVPGQARFSDLDDNGYSDAGVYVTGHYISIYAYDANGDYYWDLGDGRVYSTVPSVDDLDQDSLTSCRYVNNYRADYGNDAYMNEGWIINNIRCNGVDKGSYTYLIVSQTDPRYTGNPDMAVWGTWEYHVLSASGYGNTANPMHPDYGTL